MDDTEDDARYPPYPYGVNHQQGYGSLNRQKLPVRSGLYSHEVANHYAEDDFDDEDEDEEQLDEEEDDDGDPSNSNQLMHKDVDEDEIDDDDNDNDDDDDNENDDDNDTQQKNYTKGTEYADLERHPKKRKLKSLVSSYEFARRVPAPAPSAAAPSASNPSFGGRNALTDWSERETIVLLDSWGDRFLQHGRKSLRSEEWQEVAEKVSGVSKIERTDTQCRNRLDTLKKKYKKEKIKLAEIGGGSGTSKWVYFNKMDKLMSSPPQQVGLSCGLDSGEYVFLNPRVYMNRANGLDEMRDSPGNSESTGQEDGSDGLPPKKRRYGRENDEGSSFSLLADSIKKFTEIYEKIEHNKRLQMVELEKMRMDFHRDLEMQKRQILERAHAEIAKLRQAGDVENDDSAENASG
ncbi:Trihelix transcription factor [Quillaja saponaria]|uniref:Trihelix transcription factor n=1 Tax=Quillaja saponaria TaxID=32244 RepID=A0AAD7L581_QUISA|nr:Trihelix transcription factor [Quillaja saponaria]